jgi:hypothetical protein
MALRSRSEKMGTGTGQSVGTPAFLTGGRSQSPFFYKRWARLITGVVAQRLRAVAF